MWADPSSIYDADHGEADEESGGSRVTIKATSEPLSGDVQAVTTAPFFKRLGAKEVTSNSFNLDTFQGRSQPHDANAWWQALKALNLLFPQ